MGALAKVTIQLSLVTITGRLFSAVDSKVKNGGNKTLCDGTHAGAPHAPTPPRYPSICDTCGEVPRTSLVKGVEVDGGGYAVVTKEEVSEVLSETDAQYTSKRPMTLLPHPSAAVRAQTAPGDKLYYVTPDPAAVTNYALLVKSIEDHPELALTCLFTPRTRSSQFIATARDGVLLFEERVRNDALKPLPALGNPPVDENMAKMLDTILTSSTVDYDVDNYADTYRARLEALVKGRDVIDIGGTTTPQVAPAQVLAGDGLMEALRKQVEEMGRTA